MAKHTKEVIISYDSDEAGQAATRKAVRMLSEVGLDVKIIRMEGAKDPDEYIKKFGKDSFSRVLDSGRTGFEFKLESTLRKYNLASAEDKIKASAEMCDYISDVYSDVEREVYVAAVAKRLGISESGLKNDVELLRKKKTKQFNQKTSQEARLSAMGVGDRINRDAAKNIKAKSAEEAAIGLMLMFEEYRELVAKGKIELSRDDFFSEFHASVFERIMELTVAGEYDFSLLGQFFSPDEMGRLEGLEQKRRVLTENGRDVFVQCVETIKKEKSLSVAGDGGIDAINLLLSQKRQANNQ
jgi:DNA primase